MSPHNTVFPRSFYYIRNIYRPIERQQSQVPKSQSCKSKHTVVQVSEETAYATDRDDQLHKKGLRPTEPSTAAGTSFKITVFFSNLRVFSHLQNVQTRCGGSPCLPFSE